jgi:hypothetical protein
MEASTFGRLESEARIAGPASDVALTEAHLRGVLRSSYDHPYQ